MILILTCVLVIPFNILLNLNVDGLKVKGYFELTWIRIRLFRKEFPDEDEKKEETEEEAEEQKFDIGKFSRIISLIYESWPYLMQIFNAFLKSTKFEKFYLKLIVGLSSPYDTAITSGYIYFLMSLLNLIPKACFLFEPDFQKERLESLIYLKIRIKLLWIVIALLRAVIKKPVLLLLNELIKMK